MSVSISGAGSISGLDQGFNVTTGSVGVGTTNPRTDLQVGAFGGGDSNIQLATGTSGASNILFGDGSGGSDYYKGFIKYNHSTDNLELYTTDDLIHYTAGTERLRIHSDGKFSVGTATASAAKYTFNSAGTNEVARFESTDTGAYLAIKDSSSTSINFVEGGGDVLSLGVNSVERLRITSTGGVTIGSGNNDSSMSEFGSNTGGLTIDDTGVTNTGIRLSHGNDDTYLVQSSNSNFYISQYGTGAMIFGVGSSGNERLRITSDGDVGIGS